MDKAEEQALLQLGKQEVWSVRELPYGINADLLRGLDLEQAIEVRSCWWKDQREAEDDPPSRTIVHGSWFSPIKQPYQAGGWDSILTKAPPCELRLSEQGQVTLARLGRGEGRTPFLDPTSLLTPSRLAELFDLPLTTVNSLLRRFRGRNHNGWIENGDRGPNQPQYLFQINAVSECLQKAQDRARKKARETTSQRPAKKF